MEFVAVVLISTTSLCLGMAGSIETGYRMGKRRLKKYPEGNPEGSSAVESSIFGILGLILAFTFTGTLSRYENRTNLVLKEANAIGTAYYRLDLLSKKDRDKLRPLYREYLQSRINLFENFENRQLSDSYFRQGLKLQAQIWEVANASVLADKNPGIMNLVLSSTNEVIDVANERLQATRTHPPMIVYILLFILALASAFLVGQSMSVNQRRPLLYMGIFCVTISAITYITLDLEYPRLGLFKIDLGDKVLVEALENMQ
jgi:small nuclear ribonucleoprotein (snRNP)-like protein